MGIACCQSGEAVESALHKADQAMYEEKEALLPPAGPGPQTLTSFCLLLHEGVKEGSAAGCYARVAANFRPAVVQVHP